MHVPTYLLALHEHGTLFTTPHKIEGIETENRKMKEKAQKTKIDKKIIDGKLQTKVTL